MLSVKLRARLAGLGVSLWLGTLTAGLSARADDSSDLFLLTHLGLVRGHMLAARINADAGDAELTSMHAHHPMKEIYSSIEAELKKRNVDELGKALKALERAAEDGRDIEAPRAGVLAAVDKAEATITASSSMTLDAVVGMLRHAAEEYAAAYPADRLESLEEYQDSMGFAYWASEVLDDLKPALSKKNAVAVSMINSQMRRLLMAWPTRIPPEKPVISAAGVAKLVDRIEMEAVRFRHLTGSPTSARISG